jgi:predicted dehydrogenase
MSDTAFSQRSLAWPCQKAPGCATSRRIESVISRCYASFRMKPISVGIIGAGEIARKMHLPVLMSMPDVHIAWVADSDPARARALARAHGISSRETTTALKTPDCDVALLAIPLDARSDYLQAFHAHNVGVMCEKPFALSVAAHRQMLALYSESRLGCGYMRRLYRSVTLVREVIAKGWFGDLKSLSIREGARSRGAGVDNSFLDDPRLGATRGVLADLGSHTVDIAFFTTGASRFEVVSSDVLRDSGVDRKVSAKVKLRDAKGKNFDFDYCVSWLDRQPNVALFTFDHCSVWFGLSPSDRVFIGDPGDRRHGVELSSVERGATTYNQAFYLQWDAFLTGLRTDTQSLVSASSALPTTSLIERLLETP